MTLMTEENMFGLYKQTGGIDLSDNILVEGFRSDNLKMGYYRMKQFTLFMHIEFDLQSSDTYNLFELYSSNVKGNIALSVSVSNQTTLNMVYGGLVLSSVSLMGKIQPKKPVLLTIVKSYNESVHNMRVYVNDEDTPVSTLTVAYDSIIYVSGNRSHIELSKEKFLINNHFHQERGANMKLLNIGMLNIPLDVDMIKTMYSNLNDQMNNQLNVYVVKSKAKETQNEETITELRSELERVTACKFSPEVCGQCIDVDTSKLSAIRQSPQCYNAFNTKCELLKNNPSFNNNEEEAQFCDFLSPVVIETASNCVTDKTVDLTNLKDISLSKLSRDDSKNVPSASVELEEISLSKLSEPSEEEENEPPSKSDGEIKDYINGSMNQTDLYNNILSNYEKDLKNKIEEEDAEEVPSKNTFVEFMKYFFFMK